MHDTNEPSASQQIDTIIATYGGWKGATLATLRRIITETHPAIAEEVKWKTPSRPEGLPVWSHKGIVCIAETFTNDIKLVFFKGAYLNDTKKLFTARLKSRTDRAIELREGDVVDEAAIAGLVHEAVAFNDTKAK